MFRECGECTMCCNGSLFGEAYGNQFGNGRPCVFLSDEGKKCSIYNQRPDACIRYQCGWSQELFSEEHRPDKCGWLVSVETNPNREQYLKVVKTVPISNDVALMEIVNFAMDNKVAITIIPYRQ